MHNIGSFEPTSDQQTVWGQEKITFEKLRIARSAVIEDVESELKKEYPDYVGPVVSMDSRIREACTTILDNFPNIPLEEFGNVLKDCLITKGRTDIIVNQAVNGVDCSKTPDGEYHARLEIMRRGDVLRNAAREILENAPNTSQTHLLDSLQNIANEKFIN